MKKVTKNRFILTQHQELYLFSTSDQGISKDLFIHGEYQLKNFYSAQKILGHFLAIDPFLYEEGNPVGVKLILENLGLMQAQVRRPLAVGSEDLRNKLVNRCKLEKLI